MRSIQMQQCLGYKQVKSEIKLTNGIVKDYKKWLLDNFKYFIKVNIEESKQVSKESYAEIKHCYHNCFRVLTDKNYRYFEGFTWNKRIPIPLEHSWLVINDQVIDPTLIINVNNIKDRLGDEYIGVEIPADFVLANAIKTKRTGPFLFNY